ncbi:MAG: hypothetical protein WA790_02910 [Sulfitobacter sp.]
MTITKNITVATASVAILLSVALPSHAEITQQDFVDQQRSSVVSNCENRSGYHWSGSFENGQCVRDGSAQNSGGGGLLGTLLLVGIAAVICDATDCLDRD